jgi:hypothetical protein
VYLVSDTFQIIKASFEDPSLPNGAYIVDEGGRALAAIDA